MGAFYGLKRDALESMKAQGKAIYGKGLLLSERAAAVKWELSEKEREIVRSLGAKE